MKLFRYTMYNHTNGQRIVSQMKARDQADLEQLLVKIYGHGIELLSCNEVLT